MASWVLSLLLLRGGSTTEPPRLTYEVPILLPPRFKVRDVALTVEGTKRERIEAVPLTPGVWMATVSSPEALQGRSCRVELHLLTQAGPVSQRIEGDLETVEFSNHRSGSKELRVRPLDLRGRFEGVRPSLDTEEVWFAFQEPPAHLGKVEAVHFIYHWLMGSGPHVHVLTPLEDGRWIGRLRAYVGTKEEELVGAYLIQLKDGTVIDSVGRPTGFDDWNRPRTDRVHLLSRR